MTKKNKKKRLNIKRTLFFLLLIYIICYSIYFILNQPIKHIEITGNNLLSDNMDEFKYKIIDKEIIE